MIQNRFSIVPAIIMIVATLAMVWTMELDPASVSPIGVLIRSLWVAAVVFLAALSLKRIKSPIGGVALTIFILFWGIVCPGMLYSVVPCMKGERRNLCSRHLMQMGVALNTYRSVFHQFPPVSTCDKDGKSLYSWIVPVLPYSAGSPCLNVSRTQIIEMKRLDELMNLDESWDSPSNSKILKDQNGMRGEFQCFGRYVGWDINMSGLFYTNYIPIVGPGTMWRSEGSVKLSDLPDGGSHAVSLIEVDDSDVHWAEPFALSVDEALESIKSGTGKRVKISSCYPGEVQILFADGTIRRLPIDLPDALWRKILAGELTAKELNALKPTRWLWKICALIWLASVVILFHQAAATRQNQKSDWDNHSFRGLPL